MFSKIPGVLKKYFLYVMVFLWAAIYLLFPSVLFALNVEQSITIKQGEVEQIKNIIESDTFPSIEAAKEMLRDPGNSINVDDFINLILKVPCTRYNKEKQVYETDLALIEKQYALVNLALEAGANPNSIRVFEKISHNPQMAEVLFNNNYKKADPDIYCQYIKQQLMYRDIKGYDSVFSLVPVMVLDIKYKHLNTTKIESSPKIPRILHHLWVTNEKIKKEIPEEDIQNVLNADKIISQGGKKWEHIVWTNDKLLIPISVGKLEANGIKVKELSELNKEFKLNDKIEMLIEKGLWGMASDTIRLEIIRCYGGVFSDLNFVFYRHLESDIHRYDFFAGCDGLSVVFSGFGAIPHHPILEEAVDLIANNLGEQSKIISLLGLEENNFKAITYATTAKSLTVPYYRQANRKWTIDVLYPDNSEGHLTQIVQIEAKELDLIRKYLSPSCNEERKKLENIFNFNVFMLNNEICGPKYGPIGKDTKANSWV